MSAEQPDIDGELDRWVGRTREGSDILTAERARKLAATLDLDAHGRNGASPAGDDPARLDRIVPGARLPHGWHWIYFHRAVPRSALADDGHERRGDFLPPVPLDRRMWAGGTLRFLRPLRVGDEVTRISTIRSVEEKEGRSGPLVFVTVEHRIRDAEGIALEEEQDLVYLNRRKRKEGAEERKEGAEEPKEGPAGTIRWREPFTADEVTLFRFSALTFNGHRIHYDRRYAVEVEGYPDIVVHGPLLALLLLDAGVRWGGGADEVGLDPEGPLTFRYRARRPVFCGQTVELRASPRPGRSGGRAGSPSAGGGLELEIRGPDGSVAMGAELLPGG